MQVEQVTDLVRAGAWPAVAAFALVVYRAPLRTAIRSVATRLSGLKAGPLSFSLAVATEPSPALSSQLEELAHGALPLLGGSDVRTELERLLQGERAESFHVELGSGDRWMTSRLYLFSRLLPEVLGVRCLVFTETRGGRPTRFVGTADPFATASALASSAPWLQQAFRTAQTPLYPLAGVVLGALTRAVRGAVDEPTGATDPGNDEDDEDDEDDDSYNDYWDGSALAALLEALADPTPAIVTAAENRLRTAAMDALQEPPFELRLPEGASEIAAGFLRSPLIRSPDLPGAEDHDWVRIERPGGEPYFEHAAWIAGGAHLQQLLGSALDQSCVVELPTDNARTVVNRVVAHRGAFTAVTDDRERFDRLIHRWRLVELVAREAGHGRPSAGTD